MVMVRSSPGGAVQKMLIKIRTELIKQNKPKEKDYDLLKTIVLNEMEEIFDSNNRWSINIFCLINEKNILFS